MSLAYQWVDLVSNIIFLNQVSGIGGVRIVQKTVNKLLIFGFIKEEKILSWYL